MLAYFVREDLFSPHKTDTLVYDRFIALLQTNDVDAVLIANATNQYHHEIDAFKRDYGSLVSNVVESETPVRMENNLFHLRSSALVTPDRNVIEALNDAVCELKVNLDGTYHHQYIVLDLFDSEHFDQVLDSSKPQHIVLPLSDIIKYLEQHTDDETAELLKKAKAEFYYKTRS